MEIKIYDSEIKLMELIWEHEPVTAKTLSILAAERIGWNKNTTYTILKKLEAKGYIQRRDPGFVCSSLISREDVCKAETRGLLERLFGGSRKAMFSALLQDEELTLQDIDELRRMIGEK